MVRQPREPKKLKEPKKRRPNDVSHQEKEELDGPRKSLRWLHAGLYKDPTGNTRNIWYAFQNRMTKEGRIFENIVYAADNKGTSLGNLDVGQIKRNLITWDDHHREKWAGYLTSNGQWQFKMAKKGRRQQRDTLLATFHNRGFRDPFPNGRIGEIGPGLNVIHAPNGAVYEEIAEPRGRSYPNSRIPFSTAHIKADAYKEVHQNPLQVIAEFLSGNMSNRDKTRNQEGFQMLQLARAESAFLELGWRIDRRAAISASCDVREGVVNTLVQSLAWREHPPRRVDKFKGAAVSKMLRGFGGGGGNDDGDSEDSDNTSDSDDSDDWDGDSDDYKGDGHSKPNPLFVGERRRSTQSAKAKGRPSKGKQRSIGPNPTQKSQRVEPLDEEEGMDELEAELVRGILNELNSPPSRFRRSAPAVGEAGPSNWHIIHSDDDEDNASTFNDHNPAARQMPKYKGLMSLHHQHMGSMSKQGTTPPILPKSEHGSTSPPPRITNSIGPTPASAFPNPTGTGSSFPSPPITPRAGSPLETSTKHTSKRPSPIEIDDEPETTKRVKSADNIIMTIEGGPEYIILDDDDDGEINGAGAGTSDDPYTLDDGD